MSYRSSSPSLSSDNDSELSFSLDEDVPEISDGEFIPYDENFEPVATQAAAYGENFAREEEEERDGFFRFSQNSRNGSWFQPSYIFFHVEQPLEAILGKMFGTNHKPAFGVEIFSV